MKYRLQHNNALVNQSCNQALNKKAERQRALVVCMAPAHLELTFALSIGQLFDAEVDLEEGAEVHVVTQL